MSSSLDFATRRPDLSDFATRPCAILVIDMQADFIAPDGACALSGADVSAMPAVASRIDVLTAAARNAGLPVCFIRLETSPETDSPAMARLKARQGQPDSHALCRAGTRGARLWGITMAQGDAQIVKSRYDAFLETGLDAWLRRVGAQAVAICGVSTDCCIEATARAAFLRDYDVLVLADACAAGAPEHHEAALAALGRHAATIATVADFMSTLASPTTSRPTCSGVLVE